MVRKNQANVSPTFAVAGFVEPLVVLTDGEAPERVSMPRKVTTSGAANWPPGAAESRGVRCFRKGKR